MPKETKKVWQRFWRSRLFLLITLILAMLVALGYARAYYQDYKIKQEIQQLQTEVKSLEHKKLESMEILKYVTSDAFVEEKARTELNMKKPGENVIVVSNQAESEKKEEISDFLEAELPNILKWWYYFSHKPINK